MKEIQFRSDRGNEIRTVRIPEQVYQKMDAKSNDVSHRCACSCMSREHVDDVYDSAANREYEHLCSCACGNPHYPVEQTYDSDRQ